MNQADKTDLSIHDEANARARLRQELAGLRRRLDAIENTELREKQLLEMNRERDAFEEAKDRVVAAARALRQHFAYQKRFPYFVLGEKGLNPLIDATFRAVDALDTLEGCPECGGEGFVTTDGFDGRHYQRERPCPKCGRTPC